MGSDGTLYRKKTMATNTIWRKINDTIKGTSGKDRSGGSGRVNTTTVDAATTYYAGDGEFYIGVASEKAVTVYLPAAAADGTIIVVKAEMKPPLGNRKVQILTCDGSSIDGYSDAAITVSHGARVLIRNHGEWFIIS
jgi:hypothetical protein